MTKPTHQIIKITCAQCGEVNNCDETVLDNALICGVCAHPIETNCYPQLIKLREEREILRKSRKEEEKRKKREHAEIASEERRQQKERKQREREQIIQRKHEFANDERQRQFQAEQKERQAEENEDHQRLQHSGGCQRCGSVRLKLKDESRIFGTILGIIFLLSGVAFGGIGIVILRQAEVVFQEMEAILFLACAIVSMVGFSICHFLGSKRAYCEKCGWNWKV